MANDKIKINELPLTDIISLNNLLVTQLGENETNKITLETLFNWLSNNGLINSDYFINSENIKIVKDAVNNTASLTLNINSWQSNQEYSLNDYVVYDNSIYKCNKNKSIQLIFPTEDFDIILEKEKINIPIATLLNTGIVKPDGTTISIDKDGTIHSILDQSSEKSKWYVSAGVPSGAGPKDGWIRIPDAEVFTFEFDEDSQMYKWKDQGLSLMGPKGDNGVSQTVQITSLSNNKGYVLQINENKYEIYNGADGSTPVITSQETLNGQDIYADGVYLCSLTNGINGEQGPEGPQGMQGVRGEKGEPGPAGPSGQTPEIDKETNTWIIGGIDTGINASGIPGEQGPKGPAGDTPYIDEDSGNWFIGDIDTGIKAQGPDGVSPHIDQSTGNWFIGETNTGVKAQGIQGPQGEDGVGISSIEKTSQKDLIDTYTITLTNGATTNFTVTNGKDGITSVTTTKIDRYETFYANGWSDELPYQQTITVEGMTEELNPRIDLIISDSIETGKKEEISYGYITKAITGTNAITAYCYENKPEVDLNIMIEVI